MNNEELKMNAECAQWFWNEPKLREHRRMLVAIDNNSYNKIEGAKKKALGVVRGPSDFIFFADQHVYCLEGKVGNNIQSDEQKDFMHKVLDRGHFYLIYRSLEQFKSFIWLIIGK